VVIQVQAKTMPGKAAGVARELRWRIKRAFDREGIPLTGGAPAATVDDPAAEAAKDGPAPASAAAEEGAPPQPAAQRSASVPPPASGEE
jgi:small conductance mechanosensitive channel